MPMQEDNHSDHPLFPAMHTQHPGARTRTCPRPLSLTCIAAASHRLRDFGQMTTLSCCMGLSTWMILIASRPLNEPAPAETHLPSWKIFTCGRGSEYLYARYTLYKGHTMWPFSYTSQSSRPQAPGSSEHHWQHIEHEANCKVLACFGPNLSPTSM